MAEILISDGMRHLQNSGYGQLSRMIILSLLEHGNHALTIERRAGAVPMEGIPGLEPILALPDSDGRHDITLRIGAPSDMSGVRGPLVAYTQNALGGLTEKWAGFLSRADTVVVPGEFDREVFIRHHPNVETCHQVIDFDFFRPKPHYRGEGVDCASFLFVGSFGYRKGGDLLLPTLAEAFGGADQPVHATLMCFTGLEDGGFDILVPQLRSLPDNVSVTLRSRLLSPPWMRRVLNRHDAVFTLSRGEGWCMPLWEALSSGLPVVAPRSTAMGEFLPDWGTEFFGVEERPISELDDPFAAGMVKQYGEPGVTLYEPIRAEAVAALSRTLKTLEERKATVLRNRIHLSKGLDRASMGRRLSDIVTRTLARVS